MSVVFFEGFNFGGYGDPATLDTNYWSANKGYWFESGRTGNAIVLPSRTADTALSENATLTLANFVDPLSSAGGSNTCVGLGFWVGNALRSGWTGDALAVSPYIENLLSLTTNNGTLSVDIARPSDGNGILLAVRENGTTLSTYDLRSAAGNDWSHNSYTNYGQSYSYVGNPIYFDFFFDAANGVFSVRASGNNSLPFILYNNSSSANTTITSFNALTAITLYSAQTNGFVTSHRSYDDLYLTAGNALADVFLGSKTKIYRRNLANTISSNWSRDGNGSDPTFALQYNNGDNQYLKSWGGSAESVHTLEDMPGDSPNDPSYVSGVQFINVVRTSGPGTQYVKNTMASTSGDATQEVGPTYSVTGETYGVKNAFFFTNPITGTSWSKTAVNNMVIGVKNKS